jgi:hypothetical protein
LRLLEFGKKAQGADVEFWRSIKEQTSRAF